MRIGYPAWLSLATQKKLLANALESAPETLAEILAIEHEIETAKERVNTLQARRRDMFADLHARFAHAPTPTPKRAR